MTLGEYVICISSVTGAGGEEIGRLVAGALGLRYLDDEIVVDAAERGGVTPADISDAERRRSLLTRVLEELGTGLGAEASALARGESARGLEPTPEDLQRLVVDVIEAVALEGNVVIAAHGGSFALAERPNVFRVHVTASPETRTRRITASAGLDLKAAAQTVRNADRSRAAYLRRFYGIEREVPTQYDLVLNTDRLSSSIAAEMVEHAARKIGVLM